MQDPDDLTAAAIVRLGWAAVNGPLALPPYLEQPHRVLEISRSGSSPLTAEYRLMAPMLYLIEALGQRVYERDISRIPIQI